MRILRLDLAAFGPFTNKSIDFMQESPGLHLIYGPNEAGKSSSLRAIKCLLYGIPARSQDNFIHDNRALRIGGLIADSRGTELYFLRRKGSKDTLLDASGAPISEKVLEAFLKGVTREIFEVLFGIDHASLVAGGQNLLAGRGETGGSLFSAGTGGAGLSQIIARIEARCDAVFRPKAQNPVLNKAMAGYQVAKARISDLSVPGSRWAEMEGELQKAVNQREEVQALMESCWAELNRLRRLKELIPKVALRKEIAAGLEALGEVVILPEDFSDQRHEAQGYLARAQETKRKAEMDLRRLVEEKAAIELPERILEMAETIKTIHQRLGQHKKAASDLGKLEGGYAQNMADVERLLAEVRPGASIQEIASMRPRAAAKALVQRLGNDYGVLRSTLHRAEKNIRESGDKIRRLNDELKSLGAPKDISALKRAFAKASKKVGLTAALGDVQRELRAEESTIYSLISRLGPWTGTLQELLSLPVPSSETVNRFAAQLADMDQSIKGRKELLAKVIAERDALEQDIKALEMAGPVPTERELSLRRKRRDSGWELIKRAWLKGEDISQEAKAFDGESGLSEGYEAAVQAADEIADRLRREASRVAEYASLLSRAEKHDSEIAKIKAELSDLDSQRASILDRWHQLWLPCGLEPYGPYEMRDWSARYDKIMERAARIGELKSRAESLKNQIAEQEENLLSALKSLGKEPTSSESLDKLLDFCEALLEQMEEKARRRADLESRMASLMDTMSEAERTREEAQEGIRLWRGRWAEAIRDVGLPDGTDPEAAQLLLAKLDELFGKWDECESLQRRISGIKRDAEIFAEEVAGLVSHAADHLKDLSPEQAALSLNTELSRAMQAEARYRAIEKEIGKKKADLIEAQRDITIASERLLALCMQAGCSSPDQLEQSERRSRNFQTLKEALSTVEARIAELGGGASMEAIIREVECQNLDSISAGMERLEAEIEELKARHKKLGEEIGGLKNEIRRVDGSAAAVRAAQEAQQALAEIKNGAEDYALLRLSLLVLRKAVETYRSRNQGPLLRRAGELFARLTLGSFAGLRTDYGEGDEPTLCGLRPDGCLVGVGGMSDGTVDQLYLALRLATLERYLESNEPMPFIVDDILIRFDDERSQAALEVLSDLSRKAQVLFFTHHTRMIDLAKRIGGKAQIFFSSLS